MNPGLVAALLACIALPWLADRAGASESCPSFTPEVTLSLPDLAADVRAVPSVESYAPFPLAGLGARAPGVFLNGLTTVEPDVSYAIVAWVSQACYVPARVDVTLSYRGPARVLLNSRYPSGSCERQAILEHEMQHVEVHRLARQAQAPRVKAAVLAALAGLSVPTDEAGARAAIAPAVEGAARAMAATAGIANALLDTEESYAAVRDRCGGW